MQQGYQCFEMFFWYDCFCLEINVQGFFILIFVNFINYFDKIKVNKLIYKFFDFIWGDILLVVILFGIGLMRVLKYMLISVIISIYIYIYYLLFLL